MRRRTLMTSGGGVNPSLSAAADICLYDKSKDKLIIVPGADFSAPAYPSSSYSPVGVVVVPGTHNVYGDGSCGVMSLKEMSCSTPDTGTTSYESMYWGVSNTDITGLNKLTNAPYVGRGSSVGDASSTVLGQFNSVYLPSDKFGAVQCPHDTDAYYYNNSSGNYQAPSPYLTDDSRNPAYYQTSSPSSTSNALADFDGVGNTQKIIAQRGPKDYSSWKPTYNTETDYPAASCCDMFYTDGTKQGQWYLPACGELGYIMPKFNQIQASINALRSAYNYSDGVQLNSSENYWSSSVYNAIYARVMYMRNGLVRIYDKAETYYVRAWLRVGA